MKCRQLTAKNNSEKIRKLYSSFQEHFCRKVEKYRLDYDILWVFDGYIWYPLKPKNDNLMQFLKYKKFNENSKSQQPIGNRNKTTDNETEPGVIPAKTEILV